MKPKNEAHWKKFSKELTIYNGNITKFGYNRFKLEYNGCSILFSKFLGMGLFDYIDINFIVVDASTVDYMKLINISNYISNTGKIWTHLNKVFDQRETDARNAQAIKDKAFVEEKLFGIKQPDKSLGIEHVPQ
jgi:hypothetical protein